VPVFGRTPDLQVEAVRSIKSVQVRRIAVMPLIESPAGAKDDVVDGANETVTAELLSQMSLAAGWELVPETDVSEVVQKLPQPNPANLQQNAIALGKKVSADVVLYGVLERFKERVGVDYAAASPASVTFTLHAVDVNGRQVIWTAKFARSQKALTENVFDLVTFLQHNGRWVKAHEIAMDGVREAVNDLHSKLNLDHDVRRFPESSYEQYRMGGERYNRNPY